MGQSLTIGGIECWFGIGPDGQEGGIAESYTLDSGPEARCTFKVDWNSRQELIQSLLGTVNYANGSVSRTPPFAYPLDNFLVVAGGGIQTPNRWICTGIGAVKGTKWKTDDFGDNTSTGVPGWGYYQWANVEAIFTVPLWQVDDFNPGTQGIDLSSAPYVVTKIKTSGEVFAPPTNSVIYLGGKFAGKALQDVNASIIRTRMELSVTLIRFPIVPANLINSLIGSINGKPWQIGTYTFPRGSILFTGNNSEPRPDPCSFAIVQDVELLFLANGPASAFQNGGAAQAVRAAWTGIIFSIRQAPGSSADSIRTRPRLFSATKISASFSWRQSTDVRNRQPSQSPPRQAHHRRPDQCRRQAADAACPDPRRPGDILGAVRTAAGAARDQLPGRHHWRRWHSGGRTRNGRQRDDSARLFLGYLGLLGSAQSARSGHADDFRQLGEFRGVQPVESARRWRRHDDLYVALELSGSASGKTARARADFMPRKNQPGCPCGCNNGGGCQWFCGPTITFQAASRPALGTLTVTGGMVSAVTLTYPGAPGTYAGILHPTATVSAPPAGGTQATVQATAGGVTSATLTAGGQNYTVATVTFSAPPAGGITATGTATIVNGSVVRITITNRGGGYLANPTVTITGDGTGAKGTATAAVGQITSVTIMNPGSGYVNPAPRPRTLVLTISGNGVSYGPFTLGGTNYQPHAGYCSWGTTATITVPATPACPSFTTKVGLEVSNITGGWQLTANWIVTPVIATGNCSAFLNYSCLQAGGGAGSITPISGLPCPSRPYSAILQPAYLASPSFFNQNAAILFLLFGGYCNGTTVVPPNFPVMFALSEP